MFRKTPKAPKPAPNTYLGHPFPDYPGAKLRAEALDFAAHLLDATGAPKLLDSVVIDLRWDGAGRLIEERHVHQPVVVEGRQTEPAELVMLADFIVRGWVE